MTKTVSKSPELEHFSLCKYSENIINTHPSLSRKKKSRIYFKKIKYEFIVNLVLGLIKNGEQASGIAGSRYSNKVISPNFSSYFSCLFFMLVSFSTG